MHQAIASEKDSNSQGKKERVRLGKTVSCIQFIKCPAAFYFTSETVPN